MACQCDTCQEWNEEDGQARSEAGTNGDQQGGVVGCSSADSSSDSTGTSSSNGGGSSVPGTSPAYGRMYNLPQWLEHCTGLRISGLDPNRQPAEYRDLVLSAVEVVEDAEQHPAQEPQDVKARQERANGLGQLQRGSHLQAAMGAAAATAGRGRTCASAAPAARPMSLRNYLRHLTRTELDAAAPLCQVSRLLCIAAHRAYFMFVFCV